MKYVQAFDPLPDTVLNQILLGVSTRGYDASVPPPIGTRSRGTSRSAVSRRLVHKMSEKVKASLTSSLAEVRLVGLLIEGIGAGDQTIVVALGVTPEGKRTNERRDSGAPQVPRRRSDDERRN